MLKNYHIIGLLKFYLIKMQGEYLVLFKMFNNKIILLNIKKKWGFALGILGCLLGLLGKLLKLGSGLILVLRGRSPLLGCLMVVMQS